MAMLLATGFLFVRDALNNTLRTPEEISQKLNLPVLGVIFRHKAEGSPITLAKLDSSTAEAFRLLSTRIQYADAEHSVRSIIITSPTKAEGKSIVSVNLAIVLAQAGNSVTLIDANFNHPVIHDRLRLSNRVGLAELLLQGQASLNKEEIFQKAPIENLSVICSGENSSEVSNFNISKNFTGVLDALTEENELVVIDTAPVLNMADTVILSTKADGLLLVVQAGRTTLAEAKQAVESLRWVNARIIGVVLNYVDIKVSKHKPYYHKGKRQ
jgi:capsular exopolysaccharide synthesis family protein